MTLLRRINPEDAVHEQIEPVDAKTLAAASVIVEDVKARGETALREHAQRLKDLSPGAPLIYEKGALDQALQDLPEDQVNLLSGAADRIRGFADAQRQSLSEQEIAIPGGRAGHKIAAIESAGCYAPGGRFPLPSSVLMTVVTARAAGVNKVWVASPRPSPVILAAAAIAGADALLAVGGAQAIAALAFGAGKVPACDAVVGPGNRWVTAAKQLVAGRTKIDFLAGPSELTVLADGDADSALVAADLLAQAEHDEDARPILVSLSETLVKEVEDELEQQLTTLPTASIARTALHRGGFAVVAENLDEAIDVCDRLAPEHLHLHLSDPEPTADRLKHYGALFIGAAAAEVLADYGAGPNHVLPTGGTARLYGGLSVLDFLRVRTWLQIDDPDDARELSRDAAQIARLEGLEAHARAADRRAR